MPIYEYHCNQCQNEFEKLILNSAEKIAALNAKAKSPSDDVCLCLSSGGNLRVPQFLLRWLRRNYCSTCGSK